MKHYKSLIDFGSSKAVAAESNMSSTQHGTPGLDFCVPFFFS